MKITAENNVKIQHFFQKYGDKAVWQVETQIERLISEIASEVAGEATMKERDSQQCFS